MGSVVRAAAGLLLGALLAVEAKALQEYEETNRQPYTFSLAPMAVEVGSGTYQAADVVVWQSAQQPNGVLIGQAALGLPPGIGINVDALADGLDHVPGGAGATCRQTLYEVTVTAGSVGLAGTAIQSEPASEKASDVFGTVELISGGVATLWHYQVTDGFGIANGSEIDGLMWTEKPDAAVYFSVDPPTATALGVSAADILLGSPSGFAVWRTAADLGLLPSDDIDALSYDANSGHIRYALAAGSPSLALKGFTTAELAGGHATINGFLGIAVHASTLGLLPTDDINSVRITDPVLKKCRDSAYQLPFPPFPYEMMRISGDGGNVDRVVRMNCGESGVFSVNPIHPADQTLLFFFLGRPCNVDVVYFPFAQDHFAFAPVNVLFGPLMLGGPLQLPFSTANLPCPLVVSFQGITVGPGGKYLTNLLTLAVK